MRLYCNLVSKGFSPPFSTRIINTVRNLHKATYSNEQLKLGFHSCFLTQKPIRLPLFLLPDELNKPACSKMHFSSFHINPRNIYSKYFAQLGMRQMKKLLSRLQLSMKRFTTSSESQQPVYDCASFPLSRGVPISILTQSKGHRTHSLVDLEVNLGTVVYHLHDYIHTS